MGEFLVVNSDEVKQVFPDFNPETMVKRSLDILVELQKGMLTMHYMTYILSIRVMLEQSFLIAYQAVT